MEQLYPTPKILTTTLAEICDISPQLLNRTLKKIEIDEELIITKGNNRYLTPPATRILLENRGLEYPNENMCISSLKGGVGKSTTTISLATTLVSLGAKVCIIDIDKQANTTQTFLGDNPKVKTLYDLVNKDCSVKEAIIDVCPHLSILPASLKNSRIDLLLFTEGITNIPNYLTKLLKSIKNNFDFFILDCPPDLSTLVSMAMYFSDKMIIPTTLTNYGIDGAFLTYSHINALMEREDSFDPEIAILLNAFDLRSKSLNMNLVGDLRDVTNDTPILKTVFGQDAAFKNSQINRVPLDHYASSMAYQVSLQLAVSFLSMDQVTNKKKVKVDSIPQK